MREIDSRREREYIKGLEGTRQCLGIGQKRRLEKVAKILVHWRFPSY